MANPPQDPAAPLQTVSLGPLHGGRAEPESCDRFLALLGEFYRALPGPPAICATFVPAESIPQPQHDLLVHFSDMTSTLTRYYGEPMKLRVLQRQQGPQWYRRHIVLETESSRRPVEYGAMRIVLALLSDAARLEVLAARSPLGAVLARHGLAYRHCPGGFFRIRSNRLIEQALAIPCAAMAVWPLQLHERRRRTGSRGSRGSPSPGEMKKSEIRNEFTLQDSSNCKRPRWACPSGAEDWPLQRGHAISSRSACRRPAGHPLGRAGRRQAEREIRGNRLVVVNPSLRWGKPSGSGTDEPFTV